MVSSPNLSFLKVKIHFVNKKAFDPPRRIIPLARRPQNRSGIRSTLTRSDLVLGRLLVQRFSQSTLLSKTLHTIEALALHLVSQVAYGQRSPPIGVATAAKLASHDLDAGLQRSPNRLIHCH